MGKIFINYRRDDERAVAARIRDRLAGEFGVANVFMDVDNLMAGQRFDRVLQQALAETDAFIAVVGPRWMDLLTERQASGERDYVCEEIAGALGSGKVVIPALIEKAQLPRADALPVEIREFVLHQKHTVTHEQFGRDIAGLVEAIKFCRKSARGRIAFSWRRLVWPASGVATLAVCWALAYSAGVPVPWPSASATSVAELRPAELGAQAKAAQAAEAEALQRATSAAKLRAEVEAREHAEVEARRRAEQAVQAKAAQDARLLAEVEEATRRAQSLASLKAAEEAAERVEAEAKRQAELVVQSKATQDARVQVEAEAARRGESEAAAADNARAAEQSLLIKDIQKELKRVGCDPGAIDGKWGEKARTALTTFAGRTKKEMQNGDPSAAVLAVVKAYRGEACPVTCDPDEIKVGGVCVNNPKARVVKAPPQREPERQVRKAQTSTNEPKAAGEKKVPMCFGSSGPASTTVVPCEDPRAR